MEIEDSYVNSTYVFYSSSSQFVISQKLDAIFPDNICPGINSGSKHAVLSITYVERYNSFRRQMTPLIKYDH